MHQYKCERCGATLDPGERCDCQDAGNEPDEVTGDVIKRQDNPPAEEVQTKTAAK